MTKSNSLEILDTFALQLLSYQSLEELNKLIVEEAKKMTGSEYGAIFLVNGERLEIGISFPLLDKILKKQKLEKILKIKGLKIPQNYLLDSIKHELKENNIESSIAMPLKNKDQLTAVLLLFSSKKDNFISSEPNTISLFCSIATLALKKEIKRRELKRALDLRDRFISLASHELRTPMTSINGYIQLLHSKMKTNKTLEPRWLDALYVESIRLNNLVKEILDINRIKQGQFAFFFNEVDMSEVVQKTIDRYQVTNSEYHISFENKVGDTNALVIGDFDKLVEMVSGIISNAIKFSSPGSKISISLSKTNRTVILEIKDYGKGISKQDLETIFQGFYKGKSANIEGMGVGLFLAKNIVVNHRGKISVISKENKGTTVRVTLPSNLGSRIQIP